jgi:hypothetical protein
MEQRLRLVQGGHARTERRTGERRRVVVAAQIVWKDARGTTRIADVRTRDVSDEGVSVECLAGLPIPQFRLVHFQIDREARNRADLPDVLRRSSVLTAVFRVGACLQSTGAPGEYALRLLVEPRRDTASALPPAIEAEAGGRTLSA